MSREKAALDRLVDEVVTDFTADVRRAAHESSDEREFQGRVGDLLAALGESVGVDLLFREEYTLATAGRADAVYNRLIIEYEAPGSMRSNPNHRRAAHAIQQTKDYIDGVVEQENQDRERLLGVAGSFLMGAEDPLYPADGEGPVRRIELSSYRIDQRTVTNEDFAAFVEDTGFVTDAVRFGWSFVCGGCCRTTSRRRAAQPTPRGGGR